MATIIVFITHFEVFLPIHRLAVVPGSAVSLDSFFVLSGFLITTLMLREQSKTGRVDRFAFYRRRALRLLPALFAVIIGHAIFAALTGISFHEEWTSLMSVAFYYSNWKLAFNSNALGGHIAPGLQHLWSLSLEEQFYLVWPWVTIFILSIRRRLRTVVLVLVPAIIVIAVHRGLMYHGPSSWYADFIRTDTRADGILLGCLLAHIWIRGRDPVKYVRVAASIGAIFLLLCLPFVNTTTSFLFYGGQTAIDLACAAVILALVQGNWTGRHPLNLKPFVILGGVSYAFYLWHLPVFFTVRYYCSSWPEWTRVVVAITGTISLTALSWFCIERPALRWKDRLEAGEAARRAGRRQSARRLPWRLQPAPRLGIATIMGITDLPPLALAAPIGVSGLTNGAGVRPDAERNGHNGSSQRRQRAELHAAGPVVLAPVRTTGGDAPATNGHGHPGPRRLQHQTVRRRRNDVRLSATALLLHYGALDEDQPIP